MGWVWIGCGLLALAVGVGLGYYQPKWSLWRFVDLIYYPLGIFGVVLLGLTTQRESEISRINYLLEEARDQLDSINKITSIDSRILNEESRKALVTAIELAPYQVADNCVKYPEINLSLRSGTSECRDKFTADCGSRSSPLLISRGCNFAIVYTTALKSTFNIKLSEYKAISYTIPDSLAQRCAFSKTYVDLHESYLLGSAINGSIDPILIGSSPGLKTVVEDCERQPQLVQAKKTDAETEVKNLREELRNRENKFARNDNALGSPEARRTSFV